MSLRKITGSGRTGPGPAVKNSTSDNFTTSADADAENTAKNLFSRNSTGKSGRGTSSGEKISGFGKKNNENVYQVQKKQSRRRAESALAGSAGRSARGPQPAGNGKVYGGALIFKSGNRSRIGLWVWKKINSFYLNQARRLERITNEMDADGGKKPAEFYRLQAQIYGRAARWYGKVDPDFMQQMNYDSGLVKETEIKKYDYLKKAADEYSKGKEYIKAKNLYNNLSAVDRNERNTRLSGHMKYLAKEAYGKYEEGKKYLEEARQFEKESGAGLERHRKYLRKTRNSTDGNDHAKRREILRNIIGCHIEISKKYKNVYPDKSGKKAIARQINKALSAIDRFNGGENMTVPDFEAVRDSVRDLYNNFHEYFDTRQYEKAADIFRKTGGFLHGVDDEMKAGFLVEAGKLYVAAFDASIGRNRLENGKDIILIPRETALMERAGACYTDAAPVYPESRNKVRNVMKETARILRYPGSERSLTLPFSDPPGQQEKDGNIQENPATARLARV